MINMDYTIAHRRGKLWYSERIPFARRSRLAFFLSWEIFPAKFCGNQSPISRFCSSMKPKTSVNRPPTPDVLENPPEREPTLQELMNIKLIETGEKERLMELLRERLVECGWKDDMKALCRAFVKKKGRNTVTVDELVHVITPKGRASIPDSVKAELLQRIRTFLMSAAV